MTDKIHEHGFFILDNWLSDVNYQHLLTTLEHSYQTGVFKPAKIGQHADANNAPNIRNDQIHWLDEDSSNPGIKAYFKEINQIARTLNQTLFLGLSTIEAHFSAYQPGSFYKKHIDQFSKTMDRRISCVYYLNKDWQPEHGGELMLYQQAHQPPLRIEPHGNRLICFNSDLPHEVSTTFHMRYSIAGWLKVRPLGASG